MVPAFVLRLLGLETRAEAGPVVAPDPIEAGTLRKHGRFVTVTMTLSTLAALGGFFVAYRNLPGPEFVRAALAGCVPIVVDVLVMRWLARRYPSRRPETDVASDP